MIADPVADTLIRIKNGYASNKVTVDMPYSKLKLALCKLIAKEGYIESVAQKDQSLQVHLKYQGRKPALTDVKRVSRPSVRVYKGYRRLPVVLSGLGIAIISTPLGLLTEKQARKKKTGGEVLAEIW